MKKLGGAAKQDALMFAIFTGGFFWKDLKGVFSKPSGKLIVPPIFLFLELETSNFGELLTF